MLYMRVSSDSWRVSSGSIVGMRRANMALLQLAGTQVDKPTLFCF